MVGSNSSCPFKGSVWVMAIFIGLPVSKPNKVLGSVYVEEIQNGGYISEGVLPVPILLQWDNYFTL